MIYDNKRFRDEGLAAGSVLLPEPVFELQSYFCGCGSPSEAMDWVYQYLKTKSTGENGLAWINCSNGPEWLATYLLGHLGLTEHGVNICGAWLTGKGRIVLAFLDKYGSDFLDKWSFISESGISVGEHGSYYKDDAEAKADA